MIVVELEALEVFGRHGVEDDERRDGRTFYYDIRLEVIASLGRPVVIGFSRKRSLGRLLGDPEAVTGPLSASLAAAVTAYERGATILRAHDVKEHVEALTVARAVVAT